MKKELIKRLEIRKIQLTEGSSYPINSQHHLRDVFTVLAYLKDDKDAEKLIKNLPEVV